MKNLTSQSLSFHLHQVLSVPLTLSTFQFKDPCERPLLEVKKIQSNGDDGQNIHSLEKNCTYINTKNNSHLILKGMQFILD